MAGTAAIILAVDLNGRLVEFNKAAETALGFSRTEIIGKSLALLLQSGEDASRIVENALKQGSYQGEVNCVRKDGTVFTSLTTVSAIRGRDGSVKWIALNLQEIDRLKEAHSSILEREKSARTLLNASDESILLTDTSGIILDLNEISAQSFGSTPGELIGKSIYDLVPEDVADKIKEKAEKVLQTELPCGYEDERNFRFFGDLNFPVHFYSTIYPLRDNDNRIRRLAFFGHDIAKRGNTPVTPECGEQFCSALVQNMPVGLFRKAPGLNGRFITANLTLARMHGFDSLEEFLNMPISDFFLGPEEMEGFFRELMKEGLIKSKEVQLYRRDGTTFWGAISAFAIRDDSGEVTLIDGIVEDTSLQKQAEEALRCSEERFLHISEESEDWIWEIGRDLVIKYSNQRVKEILGYSQEEIIGKSMLDFLSDEELDRHDPGRDYLLREIIFSGQEIRMVHKEGRMIITESSGVPIFRRNRTFVGFQGQTRDITERIRIRQEEEKHRQMLIQADKMISLGVLVSGVAHEINNPNQFILINSSLLERAWGGVMPLIDRYYLENGDFQVAGIPYSELKERIPDLFAGIHEGSRRIKHIVMDLKDYARDGACTAKSAVDIEAVLKSALNILDNLVKKSTNNFRIFRRYEPLPKVNGNFQRLEQVLINLIQNACLALPDKARGISITTSYNSTKKAVLIRIKDEGIGIPADQVNFIFDLFYTTRRDSGGTGLGLPISLGIIRDHDGKLDVSSKPGKGTCITVTLPALID